MSEIQVEAPAPITMEDLWDLRATPGRVESGADSWHALARSVADTHESVRAPASGLTGDAWSGDASDSYHEHLRKLGHAVSDVVGSAKAVGDAMAAVASILHVAQGVLSDDLRKVTSAVPAVRSGGQIVFSPRTPAEVGAVSAAIAAAMEVRRGVEDVLLEKMGAVARALPALQGVAADWAGVAEGTADGWTPAAETSGTQLVYAGDDVIVDTGDGDDKITVRTDPQTGFTVITVNGVDHFVPAGKHVTLRAGSGNDTVEVAPGTNLDLTLLGGTGDDTIRGGDGRETVLGLGGRDTVTSGAGDDRVSGGAGRDYVDAGRGDDTVTGGLGDDTVYGLDGDDRISGGEGKDYLEGAAGRDTIDGNAGGDMISGGRDDDTVRGGSGDDAVYTGAGRDTVDTGSGQDVAYRQADDVVTGAERNVTVELKDLGGSIKVEGSPEFVARVRADLDMLAASPRGQQMLAALDHAHEATRAPAADWPIIGGIAYQGDTVTIRETTDENGYAGRNSTEFYWKTLSQHPTIQYNPTFDTLHDGPPVAVLYHEMAHVYDYEYETLAEGTYDKPDNPDTPNLERAAAGLPIDHDGDPSTPDRIDPDHPYELTENGLREELGAPHRPRY